MSFTVSVCDLEVGRSLKGFSLLFGFLNKTWERFCFVLNWKGHWKICSFFIFPLTFSIYDFYQNGQFFFF